jgi:hypothetical protein
MIVKAASACMLAAFLVSKLHNLTEHYHHHSRKNKSAYALLASDICTRAHLRMSIGAFNNCNEAQSYVDISPLQRAIYSLAEEMHVCGNDRCAILYIDITERLPYMFALIVMVLALTTLKLARDYRHHRIEDQCAVFRLPSYGENTGGAAITQYSHGNKLD